MKERRGTDGPLSAKGNFLGMENRASREPVSVGVPLVKLIKRRLTEAPDIAMLGGGHNIVAERFRRLRTILANIKNPPQVIVVSSASPAEGKTTVSLNLALACASDQDERVVLVDADLRRPSIGRKLEPRPQFGLSEILLGRTELDHAVLRLDNAPLEVLPAGEPAQDPMELLSSARAEQLVAALRERYKIVIIDTPPIVPFTDADVIGRLSDGVLLVACSGVTPAPSIKQAISTVTSARVLGVVLNQAKRSLADWNQYQNYDYYRYYEQKRNEK